MTPPRSTSSRHASADVAPLGAPAAVGRAGSDHHGPAGGPLPHGMVRDVSTGPASEDRVSGGHRGVSFQWLLPAAARKRGWVSVRAREATRNFGRDLVATITPGRDGRTPRIVLRQNGRTVRSAYAGTLDRATTLASLLAHQHLQGVRA